MQDFGIFIDANDLINRCQTDVPSSKRREENLPTTSPEFENSVKLQIEKKVAAF